MAINFPELCVLAGMRKEVSSIFFFMLYSSFSFYVFVVCIVFLFFLTVISNKIIRGKTWLCLLNARYMKSIAFTHFIKEFNR